MFSENLGERVGRRQSLILRPMTLADIEILFDQKKDGVAVEMAAFTSKDPQDAAAFMMKTKNLIANQDIDTLVIEVAGKVVGDVMGFEMFGRRSVCYWLGREYWGRGYATEALKLFVDQFDQRPLVARVVHDNAASLQVLQKCGFKIVDEEVGFAAGRGAEVRELILELKGTNS